MQSQSSQVSVGRTIVQEYKILKSAREKSQLYLHTSPKSQATWMHGKLRMVAINFGNKVSIISTKWDVKKVHLAMVLSVVTIFIEDGQLRLGLHKKVHSTMEEDHSSFLTTSTMVNSQTFLSKVHMTVSCISSSIQNSLLKTRILHFLLLYGSI